MTEQNALFRGIYEFEDPSGTVVAARIPPMGATDLYQGTKIIVRPNQVAILIYKGQLADTFPAGTHELSTQNIPVITRLMNWKYGFESALKAEIWFFGTQVFIGRRWGTAAPVIASLGEKAIPLRAFGNYNVRVKDARKLYLNMIGSRSLVDVSELDQFIQGQILEALPQALGCIREFKELGTKQSDVSRELGDISTAKLQEYGLDLQSIQALSILPTSEVMNAIDEKLAIDIVGDKRDYLMYKAANALEHQQHSGAATDSVQMMMGLMMSKDLLGTSEQRSVTQAADGDKKCAACNCTITKDAVFCPKCGTKVKT